MKGSLATQAFYFIAKRRVAVPYVIFYTS